MQTFEVNPGTSCCSYSISQVKEAKCFNAGQPDFFCLQSEEIKARENISSVALNDALGFRHLYMHTDDFTVF